MKKKRNLFFYFKAVRIFLRGSWHRALLFHSVFHQMTEERPRVDCSSPSSLEMPGAWAASEVQHPATLS